MDDREKGKAFEALLARGLRGNPQPSAEECPDADLLAAYFDRALGEAEKEHWERHFAACAHCQQALAALSRSATVGAVEESEAGATDLAALRAAVAGPLEAKAREVQAGGPQRATAAAMGSSASALPRLELPKAPRRLLNWRWLVPAVGIAAAVAMWVVLRPAPPQRIEIAQRTEPPAEAAETLASPQKLEQPSVPSTEASAAKESAPSAESQRHAVRLDALEGAGAAKPAAPPPVARARATREKQDRAAVAGGATKGKTLSAASTAKAAQRAKQTPAELGTTPAVRKKLDAGALQAGAQRADQMQPAPLPSQPSESAAQTAIGAGAEEKSSQDKPQTGNETVPVTGAAPPAPRRELKSKLAAARPGEAPTAGGAELRARDAIALRSSLSNSSWVLVLAPSAVARWRIGPAGAIERWRGETRSWEAQVSGVTADLLAGSALSESVCWVVGREGIILRTTDGVQWEKVTSPAPVDWVGVSARDARQATLTSPSGLRYITSDGGRNWRALPMR